MLMQYLSAVVVTAGESAKAVRSSPATRPHFAAARAGTVDGARQRLEPARRRQPAAPWGPPGADCRFLSAGSVALAMGAALAYLLFFRLIACIGAARTFTVSFLIPLFGVL